MDSPDDEAGTARPVDFLLLGGGLASATAAETLRLEGTRGSIVIVAAEPRPPYQRPPLSTGFMRSDAMREPAPVLSADAYREHEIELLLGTRALALDPQRRLVRTDRAGRLRYGKLLIATGARAKRLDVPGAALPGVHSLRSADDALAIRGAARRGARAVVVGASFIGLELSASLAQRGVRVTLLARHEDAIFDTLHEPSLSRFFAELCRRHGVAVAIDEVARLDGDRAGVRRVLTRSGAALECDFVVQGIGVVPELEFLAGSGLALDDGVTVDAQLRASEPDIYAAGDVANFFDPVFNVRRRIEHWDNALRQGRLAARNMLGARLPYDEVSGFFGQVFEVGFQFLGRAVDAPGRARIGEREDGPGALLYLKDDVPRALFTSGRPARETRAIQALIRHRTNIAALLPRIAQPGFSLDTVPAQMVLILQGGGAMGAFECGVVRALEERAIQPDIVAGVSIGAFNGAIIAAHPRHAAEALADFWSDLAVVAPALPDARARQLLALSQILLTGVPAFFRPRWFNPLLLLDAPPAAWTWLYDPAPAKALLAKYVDFSRLASSPVRLLISAVDVETAQLAVFDSYVDALGPEHILASGSLPPAFPWTTIGARHYWDGGIISNSPLELVVERCGAAGKRIVIVDLFSSARPLPDSLMEVIARRDEIVYAERIRRDSGEQALLADFRKLVEEALALAEPGAAAQLRQQPRYTELMGDETTLDITRIVRRGAEDESPSRDYDFSLDSIRRSQREGYATARRVLSEADLATTRVRAKPRPRRG